MKGGVKGGHRFTVTASTTVTTVSPLAITTVSSISSPSSPSSTSTDSPTGSTVNVPSPTPIPVAAVFESEARSSHNLPSDVTDSNLGRGNSPLNSIGI